MATHTVAAGAVGTGPFTLAASTVDTVTFAEDLVSVEVVNPSTNSADVWYSLDGSTPTVGGTMCYYLPVGTADNREPKTADGTTVKLISSGTPTVVVQRGD